MQVLQNHSFAEDKSPKMKRTKDKENSSCSPLCSPKKPMNLTSYSQVSAFEDITNSPNKFGIRLQQVPTSEKEKSPLKVLYQQMKNQCSP